MNSKQYLAERKRLEGLQDLAKKYGDSDLSESLGRRISKLKRDNSEVANETVLKFASIAESRRVKLNEDTDKVKKFLRRLADDLGVYPSVVEKSVEQTDKLDRVTPTAVKGSPIYLWTGETLTAILTFSTDADTSSVKASFDDDTDKHLIRSFQLAKDDFFDGMDEIRNLKQVKMNNNFGSAKNFKKASDFTKALEKHFGASAFQTHEDGIRSFVLDETGIKRLEAYLKREGMTLQGEATEAPDVSEVPDTDNVDVAPSSVETEEAGDAGEETKIRFQGEFSNKLIADLKKQFGAFGFGKHKNGDKGFAIKGAFSMSRLSNFMSNNGLEIQFDEAYVATNEDARSDLEAKFGDFPQTLAKVWMKYFKNGTARISPAALGSDTFFLTFFMIGSKEDQDSNIWENDPLMTRLVVEQISEGQFAVERMQGDLFVKPPEDSHLAMGRVKIAFRKFKGDEKKVTASLDKYVKRARGIFDDNRDNIFGADRIDSKYFESMVTESSEFEKEKAKRDQLDSLLDDASAELNKVTGGKKGNMGLVPDEIKNTPEYKAAKAKVDSAFNALKTFNKTFVKKYKKELRDDRDNRRKASLSEMKEFPGDGRFDVEVFELVEGKTSARELKKKHFKKLGPALKEARSQVADDRMVRIMGTMRGERGTSLFFQKIGSKYGEVIDQLGQKDLDQDNKFVGESDVSEAGKSTFDTYPDFNSRKKALHRLIDKRGDQTSNLTKEEQKEYLDLVDWWNDLHESKLSEDGMTQAEAVALAKKALAASDDQKEALMKILNNVGYIVKNVGGKNKLTKGDTEVTLEALAEARSALSEESKGKLEVIIDTEDPFKKKKLKVTGTVDQVIVKLRKAFKKYGAVDFAIEDFSGFNSEDDARLSKILQDIEVSESLEEESQLNKLVLTSANMGLQIESSENATGDPSGVLRKAKEGSATLYLHSRGVAQSTVNFKKGAAQGKPKHLDSSTAEGQNLVEQVWSSVK